jgi:hypothetical protein
LPAQTAKALLTKAAATAGAVVSKAAPTAAAGATRLVPTLTGAANSAARTATALAPTLKAGATLWGPTAVAAGKNAARTATAMAPTLKAAATRWGPTAAAAVTYAGGTATALAPTLKAGATNLAPTAAAAGTSAARTATVLAPTLVAGATLWGPTGVAMVTNAARTATALAPTWQALTPPVTVPAEEAAQAITAYGNQVLGVGVTAKKATGWTGTIDKSVTQTSASSAAQSATAKIAAKTYEALLANGAASLSYGSGTVTGDVTVDVQGSSLGVYSFVITATSPVRTAEAALALAKATFPALKDLTYTPYPATTGYAWTFQGFSNGYDLKTKKVTTLAEVVILYVMPAAGGKTANVTATVGRGDFASQLKVP